MIDAAARTNLRTWSATGLISLGVVVVCVLLVSDGDVSSTERSVFRAVNDLPDALESPMVGVQYAGVAIVPFVVAAIAAVLPQVAARRRRVARVPVEAHRREARAQGDRVPGPAGDDRTGRDAPARAHARTELPLRPRDRGVRPRRDRGALPVAGVADRRVRRRGRGGVLAHLPRRAQPARRARRCGRRSRDRRGAEPAPAASPPCRRRRRCLRPARPDRCSRQTRPPARRVARRSCTPARFSGVPRHTSYE